MINFSSCVLGRNKFFILSFEIFIKFSINIINEDHHFLLTGGI